MMECKLCKEQIEDLDNNNYCPICDTKIIEDLPENILATHKMYARTVVVTNLDNGKSAEYGHVAFRDISKALRNLF